MLKGSTALFGLLLWPLALSPAAAQVRQGFDLDFYSSYLWAQGGKTQVVDRSRAREVRTKIDSGISSGARLTYNFNRHFGVEGSAGGSTNNYLVRLFDSGSEVSVEDTNATFFLHGNGVLHLARGRVVPFLTAGAGAMAFVDQPALAVNYGGGVKIFLTRRVALRFDVRQYHTTLNDTIEQVVPSRTGLVEVPQPYDDRLRFRELGVGISFHFGRKD
jgi:hypothetical protein